MTDVDEECTGVPLDGSNTVGEGSNPGGDGSNTEADGVHAEIVEESSSDTQPGSGAAEAHLAA